MESYHESVLYEETLEGLNIRPEGIYFDGTTGGAGHASGIAARLTGNGRLISVDQDKDALLEAKKRLAPYEAHVTLLQENYRHFGEILNRLSIDRIDGILLDLGVSSHQFDDAERGFSYRFDAPLDMRMDQTKPLTAREIVNTAPEEELARILWQYGEEHYAKKIAWNIVKARKEAPIETTFELVDAIRRSMPSKILREGGHPAKQTFQALRIAVNEELDVLEETIDGMIDRLSPGGRMAVITFHSLEDRIVKQHFKTAESPCVCPPELPVCVCGRVSKGKVLTRKPVTASKEELERNPRSHSAHLRIFERAPF